MPRYLYKATDARGQPVAGAVEGESIASAEAALVARGLARVDVALDASDHRPLTDREVADLLDRLAALTRAGAPLPAGLRAAAAEVESPPLRAVLGQLADRVDRGAGLDEALASAAGQFPAQLTALARVGVRAGRLADVLGEAVRASNLGVELHHRLRLATAYPATLLVVIVGLTLFICHASSRMGEPIDSGLFGIDPPAGMVVSLALARFVATYDGLVGLGLLGLAAAGWLAWRHGLAPAGRRRWLESVPLYGPLLRVVGLAEFCHLVALLVAAELPLPGAIRLAGASVRDPSLAATCADVADGVAAGEPLALGLRRWAGLPAGLGQLLAWGEANQELAKSLRFAGDMFEARAEAQAAFAGRVAAAILMILVLVGIGFAIASVYLPIIWALQIISRLAG